MSALNHSTTEAAHRSSSAYPDHEESPRTPAHFLELQRKALRRFRVAETERGRAETSATAEIQAARAQASSATKALEVKIAGHVGEVEAVLPDARKALERVGMAGLLDRSARVDLPERSPYDALLSAVERAHGSVREVATTVGLYQEALANRRTVQSVGAIAGAIMLIFVLIKVIAFARADNGISVTPAPAISAETTAGSTSDGPTRESPGEAVPAPSVVGPAVSAPTPSESAPASPDPAAPGELDVAAVSPRITLQYQMREDAATVSDVHKALKQQSGWKVGSPERVLPAGDNKPEVYGGVRFYFEEDSVLARTVCDVVRRELAQRGYDVTFPLWPMVTLQRQGYFRARRGLIEVWISPLPQPTPGGDPAQMGRCGR